MRVELLERYLDNPEVIKQARERSEIPDEVYPEKGKIKELMNRLKPSAIQRFIDPGYGIQVTKINELKIHGVVGELEANKDSNKSF